MTKGRPQNQKYISFHVTKKKPVARTLYYPRNEDQGEAWSSLSPSSSSTVGEQKKQALETLNVMFTVYNEEGEEIDKPDFRHRYAVEWIRTTWDEDHPLSNHQDLYCPMDGEWTEDMKEALDELCPSVNCVTQRKFDNFRMLGQRQKLYEIDPSLTRRVLINE